MRPGAPSDQDEDRLFYCKDDGRRGTHPNEKFDTGVHVRSPTVEEPWGKYNLSPGVSNAETKAIRREIRRWQLRCRVDRWTDATRSDGATAPKVFSFTSCL